MFTHTRILHVLGEHVLIALRTCTHVHYMPHRNYVHTLTYVCTLQLIHVRTFHLCTCTYSHTVCTLQLLHHTPSPYMHSSALFPSFRVTAKDKEIEGLREQVATFEQEKKSLELKMQGLKQKNNVSTTRLNSCCEEV